MIAKPIHFDARLMSLLVCFTLSSSAVFNGTNLHELMTLEERLQFFGTEKIGEYNLISVTWQNRYKRSNDNTMVFNLTWLDDKNNSWHMKRVNTFYIFPDTPAHVFYTSRGRLMHKVEYPCNKTMPEIYEDTTTSILFVVHQDHTGKRFLDHGIMGQNVIKFSLVPNNLTIDVRTYFSVDYHGSPTHYYVAQYVNSTEGVYSDPILLLKDSANSFNKNLSMPDIHLEILPVVDYSLAQKFSSRVKLYDYLIQFWSLVSLIYRRLREPEFKITLTGMVIAEDPTAFSFIEAYSQNIGMPLNLNYLGALNGLSKWLYAQQERIPFQNYDVAILHTSKREGYLLDRRVSTLNTLGIAKLRSACQINHNQQSVEKVGLIYDNGKYANIAAAAHEVAHTLGAENDKESCQVDYLMSIRAHPRSSHPFTFSKCSIDQIKAFLATSPACLYFHRNSIDAVYFPSQLV